MDKVLKFEAQWCAPCKMMTTALKDVDIGLPIEPVDIEQNEDLAKQYEIRGVPTLVLLRNDAEVSRLVGMQSVEKIKNWVTIN